MNRRAFIKGALAAGTVQALSLSFPGLAASIDKPVGRNTRMLGWQSVDTDRLAPLAMEVSGTIPSPLKGCFYRNGPAKHERNGVHYRHWFDGDGMVQKFTLSEAGITHQGQFVHTRKYVQEQQVGKFLFDDTGTKIEGARPGRNNDTSNTANTALLPWDDELLALWEGGSAYRLDPDSLQTLGVKIWRQDLQNVPFSAHPLVDKDGTLWNFGLATYAGKNGTLLIYRIEPKSGLRQVQPIALPMAGFMHDFAMTGRHLVFYLPPYVYSPDGGATYVERFAWQPQKGGKVLVVDKDDLSRLRWFDAPAGFVFHFGNAFEQGNELSVNVSWYRDATIMQHSMFDMMAHGQATKHQPAMSSLLKIDLQKGRAKLEQSDTALEFPSFDERFSDQVTALFGVGRSEEKTGSHRARISRFDPKTGRSDFFQFAEGIHAEEPLFIARKDKPQEGAGWLVNTFLDDNKRRTGITIFDAQHLSDGPVAVATMARHLPLGFHGCFVG